MCAMLRRLRLRRALIILLVIAVVAPLAAFAALWFTLPDVGQLYRRTQTPSTRILDRHGRLLYEIFDPRSLSGGRHTPIPLERIPLRLRQATIAVEDASFYDNPGVDLVGIARALWINLRGGEALAGGSTITQQLARMLLLDPDERSQRTLLRKLRESLLAWQIAQRYSKDEVLALYLNQVYYGNLAYGVEAAARTYFGRSVSELDLAECALLAGLPQSPTAYDPFNDPALAKRRQLIVLDLMVKHGMISEDEALAARQARLSYAPAPFEIRAPHFVSYVRHWLERELGVDAVVRGGLVVTTTLDLALNDAAQEIVRAHLRRLANPADRPGLSHNANNAALVALDPRTGEILAMVGSPNYFDARISGAVNAAIALRQPGSAIKPITYAAAFARGALTAATPIYDVRTAFPTREGLPYVPVNYDRRHYGPISARQALATSNNTAAVSVLQRIGIAAMLDQAHAMGIRSFKAPDRYGLALTLGGGEVRLLELVAAYGAFANEGRYVAPYAVLAVTAADGRPLFKRSTQVAGRSVLDARVAWLISDILADNAARAPAFGESSALKLSRPAAVKTGTTTDFRDNWTVGYTPQIVAGVWVGNADGQPMQRISGVTGAGPIWHDFMEIAHRALPMRWFERPPGLVRVEVCALSGMLPSPDCPQTRMEWFLEGTQPTQPDTWHRRVPVDGLTGRPASPDTPRERIAERVMLDLPAPLRDWARAQGWPVLDPVADPAPRASVVSRQSVAILRPDPGTIYRAAKELPPSVQRAPLEVRVDAADVASVDVALATGEVLVRFDRAPYRAFWRLHVGRHTLVARAHLRDGRVIESEPVHITVLP
ncbi:MAG: penicillin-binding protein [Candidatus Thermofonsia Clade 3 bacterium]|uniref:Penicillin-binding protein n=1 Tax=Candidatus Thermofonsia Clade 3 bacterium TaxID=2364212 RepID=A0A2M8QEK4_9CHLR|nr:MAG: penicillin-binding protein [Candidatus Thermofonsia Clade 3 bacterium]